MSKPRTGKNINCLNCGKEVYIPKNRFATAKYCSLVCKGLHEKEEISAVCAVCGEVFTHISSRVNKAKYCSRMCYYKAMNAKGTVVFNCFHCGKEFFGSPSEKRKYCSRKCVSKFQKAKWFPNYTTVRKQLISRNKLTQCALCGYSEEPRILGVHHIDKNRQNNELSNLVVLCPMCHSLAHLKHIVSFSTE